MKYALMLLTVIASSSTMASVINYQCKTLGGKDLEFTVDFSKVPKRLVEVKENGVNITNQASLDQGTKNTFAVILGGGQVRIEKTGAMTYQQVVVGGKPGAINCTPKVVPAVGAPVKPLY